jgi:hypothetical protein
MDADKRRCSHTGCTCQAQADGLYCSQYCATHDNDAQCGCGHAACRAAASQSVKL